MQVSIAGETASTYVQLRGLQERLRVARENDSNQRETLNLVEARYKAGRDTEYELALARYATAIPLVPRSHATSCNLPGRRA